jgi:hypothetical protein
MKESKNDDVRDIIGDIYARITRRNNDFIHILWEVSNE